MKYFNDLHIKSLINLNIFGATFRNLERGNCSHCAPAYAPATGLDKFK